MNFGRYPLELTQLKMVEIGIQIMHIGNNVEVRPIGKQPAAPVIGA
uniref:Uncharacterized protein n=1 Tax=Romanomermis culicivorax TaxID=13658 RepID=A0A915LAR9_ROMCU